MELIQFQSPKEVLQTPHHQQNKLKLTLQANLNLKEKKKHDTFGNTSTYPSHQQKTQILF